MTNQEKIEKVKKWQKYPYVHPLTCGNDSRHPELQPVDKEGEVRLECSECGYSQSIPDFVLQAKLKMPENPAP